MSDPARAAVLRITSPRHRGLDVPRGTSRRAVSPHAGRDRAARIRLRRCSSRASASSTRVRARGVAPGRHERSTAAPIVAVFRPAKGALQQEVVLPATAQAYTDAPIYARTNGYLKKWYADIGARVQQGPASRRHRLSRDRAAAAGAKADLATAQANERLARETAQRYRRARQDRLRLEAGRGQRERRRLAARHAAHGVVAGERPAAGAARAFERINAPFDGVITARNTDIGQLVDSGSSGGPARELFHIATLDRLRVFVGVPQTGSGAAFPGLPVDIEIAGKARRAFTGKIVRNSHSIDPSTRTMLVEIDLENPNGQILPGRCGQVHLKLARSADVLLPVNALIFRSEGPRVATLDAGNAPDCCP